MAKEFCVRCKKTTESKAIEYAAGTEFVCCECGTQVDFLHNDDLEVEELTCDECCELQEYCKCEDGEE